MEDNIVIMNELLNSQLQELSNNPAISNGAVIMGNNYQFLK
jgi:hypothetical protein